MNNPEKFNLEPEPYSVWTCNDGSKIPVMYMSTIHLINAINYLKECKGDEKWLQVMEKELGKRDDGKTQTRKHELLEADRKGRVAILPCKPGDKVYIVVEKRPDCSECKSCMGSHACPTYLDINECRCERVSITFYQKGPSRKRSITEISGPEIWNAMWEDYVLILGIDGSYYLTRREAKAALLKIEKERRKRAKK
jgi:hypothetical protein